LFNFQEKFLVFSQKMLNFEPTKQFKPIIPKIIVVMKIYQTNEIKNIALLGSAGSGKTTLAEAMVY